MALQLKNDGLAFLAHLRIKNSSKNTFVAAILTVFLTAVSLSPQQSTSTGGSITTGNSSSNLFQERNINTPS